MTTLRYVFLIMAIFSHSVISEHCYARSLTSELFSQLPKAAFCIVATKDIRTVHNRRICMDGTYVDGVYCGVGKCNIFGFNCDGGCKVSGTTNPPLGCDTIYNNRNAIIDRFKYCTETEESSPSAYDMSGGLLKSSYYKNECIDTCEHARFKYEKIRSDCRSANIGLVTIDLLTFGLATPIVGPPLVWCAVIEQIAKSQKDRLCQE
ncbi:hypothetical protein QTP88_002806 [Uroleucon formosanum]